MNRKLIEERRLGKLETLIKKKGLGIRIMLIKGLSYSLSFAFILIVLYIRFTINGERCRLCNSYS